MRRHARESADLPMVRSPRHGKVTLCGRRGFRFPPGARARSAKLLDEQLPDQAEETKGHDFRKAGFSGATAFAPLRLFV